jgi:hypothetical protein
MRIDGLEYDTTKIGHLSDIEKEPIYLRLKERGKEMSFPRIERVRQLARDGWGPVTEIGPTGQLSVFTDRLEELVLVYHPVDPQEREYMPTPLSMSELRSDALRLARRLYERSNGNFRWPLDCHEEARAIGLEDRQQVDQVVNYLHGKGMLGTVTQGGLVTLSQAGVAEIERAIAEPDKPTAYFPAVNIIQAQNLHIGAGAQIVQGSANQVSQQILHLNELNQALARIEVLAKDLGEADRRQIASLAETVRVAIDKPQPDQGTVKTILGLLRRVAEGAAASAAGNAAGPAIVGILHGLQQLLAG